MLRCCLFSRILGQEKSSGLFITKTFCCLIPVLEPASVFGSVNPVKKNENKTDRSVL